MKLLVILLAALVLLLAGILFKYQRQIKDICRQLAFVRKHESNMLISREIEGGGVGPLCDLLNEVLEDERQQRKKYSEKERWISDTYTNLSHDIRTPLTSLDGYFQLLQDSEDRKERERYGEIIRERIGSLKEMLEELFTFTKVKNDAFRLELSPCRLDRILTELVLSYYGDWQQKGISPEIRIPEEAVWVLGNELALVRSIQNAIKNALDHGERKIRISLAADAETVQVEIGNYVQDPEQVDPAQVFERFYKADPARSKSSSGLGLSIAKEFVLRMNGSISADVEGNWFVVTIVLLASADNSKG